MPGKDGEGVYKLAKRLGFSGSEQDFLASLKGASGKDGKDGSNGLPGLPGTRGLDGTNGKDGLPGVRGKQGPRGPSGADGSNGWTPILAIVEDGERRVQQVVDWVGGSGPKPERGLYVGPDGFTSSVVLATDIRGPAGREGRVIGGFSGINRRDVLELIETLPNLTVRIVSTDTTVTEDDDIIIATAEATITVPDATATTKFLRIKRSGSGDVTVQGVNGQTIEGEAFRVINVNLYSLTLHSDGTNWVEL